MQDKEAFEDFFQYLDPDKIELPWVERGLVPDAPVSALKAYDAFVKREREFKKEGIVV